jgi:hypothetical protein
VVGEVRVEEPTPQQLPRADDVRGLVEIEDLDAQERGASREAGRDEGCQQPEA